MQRLRDLCTRHDILLICDEIQVGCGRTGPFFSFERAGIVPDLVVLSKSISGYGLPMAISLLKPELDIWSPGEHTGTFRGNQLAFVGAAAALEYREFVNLETDVHEKEQFVSRFLHEEIAPISKDIQIRGMGLLWGVDVQASRHVNISKDIAMRCYDLGLILERVGRQDAVIKLMPPLTISMEELEQGCGILKRSVQECFERHEQREHAFI